jgi:hypothetical protein
MTPFKPDIDVFFIRHLGVFNESARLVFSTINEMNKFLAYDYDQYTEDTKPCSKKENASEIKESKPEEKYEDKYLQKFKAFINEYSYTEEETKKYHNKYEELRVNAENKLRRDMEVLFEKLDMLQMLSTNLDGNINIDMTLFELFNLYEELVEDVDFPDFDSDSDEEESEENHKEERIVKFIKENKECMEQLKGYLLKDYKDTSEKLEVLKNTVVDLTEIESEARAYALKNRLDSLINSFVIEYTPLGNVIMRYNNEKGSFEYYSNNSIPYRYLEPIGRKYVTTYFCKPLFIDLEEELKRAEEKFDMEKEKNEEKQQALKMNEPKKIFANLKSYNANIVKTTPVNLPSKNRSTGPLALPPQIKANLPNVNSNTKQLLKEHANRYTWEGRFANLSLLKKVDRKQIDKKYAMTWADFKKNGGRL